MANSLWVHNGSPQLDADSQYKKILAVSLSLSFIMATLVTLRGYIRGILLKTIGADDYVIFFAMLCSITYNGLCIGQTKWGLGLTVGARPLLNAASFAVLNFAGKPIYVAGILGFKISICLSYLRILSNASHRYIQVVWAVLITCTMGHLAGILLLIFLCSPIQRSWKPKVPGKCVSNADSIYVLGSISIFFDVVILILPIPVFLGLQINTRKKVALIGMFALGIFTTFCSIMRLAQITSILRTGDQTGLVLWATIELNVGISLTCLPTLMPLIKYYRDKKTSSQGTYNLENTTGNRLRYIKTPQHVNLPGNSKSGELDDQDNTDSSSQKNILRSNRALGDGRRDENSSTESLRYGLGNNGIKKTTDVNVNIRAITAEERGNAKIHVGSNW